MYICYLGKHRSSQGSDSFEVNYLLPSQKSSSCTEYPSEANKAQTRINEFIKLSFKLTPGLCIQNKLGCPITSLSR